MPVSREEKFNSLFLLFYGNPIVNKFKNKKEREEKDAAPKLTIMINSVLQTNFFRDFFETCMVGSEQFMISRVLAW